MEYFCYYNRYNCSILVSRIKTFVINWNFDGFKYDCSRFIWNISSSIFKKVNIDPALASSVFVTTITDVIGFLSFLGIGSYFFLN